MKNRSLKKVLKPLPKISVSILNSDLADLKNVVHKLESAGIEVLHLDIMDGHFVDNLTFGPQVVKSLRKHTRCFFDVHLMIENPQKTIKEYIHAGSDLIVFHYESLNKNEIEKLIFEIKQNNIFCGISIKPKTDVKKIINYLKFLDLVLIMTVEPGFGGQKILVDCINKIKILNKYRRENNLDFLISSDGGINEENIKEIILLGCDLPVVGNAIFKHKNFVSKTKYILSLTKKFKYDI
ncbi:MAG: ribulose-phosphate 3-epimerase [Endomicrobiia bacterium]